MVKALEKMVEYLNNELGDDTAHMGYGVEFIKRPAVKAGVYVTLSHGLARTSGVNFSAYVYSPLRDSGKECIKLAEKVMLLLLKCTNPCVSSLNVGRVNYNSNSGAFRVELTGVAVSRGEGDFSVSAFDFSKNSAMKLSFLVGDVKFNSVIDDYPIMTMCSEVPVGVVEKAERYEIVMSNVGSATANVLATNGSFSMIVSDGKHTITYSHCICTAVNRGSPFDGAADSVEIKSYGKIVRGIASGG